MKTPKLPRSRTDYEVTRINDKISRKDRSTHEAKAKIEDAWEVIRIHKELELPFDD